MEKEYIVTVHKGVDWTELHQEIIAYTGNNDSVDSSIVPDREVNVADERSNNQRNTHYFLTVDEAIALMQDPRVASVQAVDEIAEPSPAAIQVGNFERGSSSVGQKDNWGLIRHTSQGNVYGNSTIDPGLDYHYSLTGKGVDIVIMDTGIQVDHPEWENELGVSRLIQLDWFEASGVSGSMPANFYTDVNGHGTHCAATMAGKTFGWAKDALIYSLTTYGNPGRNISFEQAVDCLIGWHNNKPINPETGFKRPTIVNMSFTYTWFIDVLTTPNEIRFLSGGPGNNIVGGRYRGTTHSETEWANLKTYGVIGSGSAVKQFGRKYASKDADVEQLLSNGIHVCTAAGNDYTKIDIPGGQDYNNYLRASIAGINGYFYYNRGPSPSVFEGGNTYSYAFSADVSTGDFNPGFDVGSIDNTSLYQDGGYSGSGGYRDKKSNFSNSGPGVGIWATGDSIISAAIDGQGSPLYYDSNYRQVKKSGTSMAAPQVCGIMACILQAHPDWSPEQVTKYMIENSQDGMYDTGNNDDYINNSSIHGGNDRIAYLPMNGSKTFGYGSVV